MIIERHQTNDRMSRVVNCKGILYLAGCVSSTQFVTIEDQTRDILLKLEGLLEGYGSNKDHILTALIHLKDISLFEGMNSVWDTWFEKGKAPARTCIEAKMASGNSLIEITITAALLN